MTIYDKMPMNRRMLLDLPFLEGVGAITQDVAKPHHAVTLVAAPTWGNLASGKSVLTLNGTSQYLQCLNALCADLGFTSGDYSVGGWIDWTSGIVTSQIIAGRYELNVGGWELYLTIDGALDYLTLRHHHAGGEAERSACYSLGWEEGVPCLFGVSRSGASAAHYRNGVSLDVVGELEDAEATTSDLVIGARYTKDANFFKNNLGRIFISGEALSADDWLEIYELGKAGFVL